MGLPQVTHEAAARDRAVDLKASCKNSILNRNAWATIFRTRRLAHTAAKIEQQVEKHILFVRLRGVVCAPILRIRLSLPSPFAVATLDITQVLALPTKRP